MMLKKPKKIRNIYMDHSATAPIDKRVFLAMKPFFMDDFGNPSALYSLGRRASKVVNNARKTIAELIGALPENIIFTAGGSEANNLALFGVAKANHHKGKHIISIAIEHHSVLHPLKELKKQGFDITFIPINKQGIVSAEDITKAIRPETILVSIMFANNEMGAIEPIADIGREILKYRKTNNTNYPLFHSDACQAAGYLDINVEKNHLDLMTVNGSKIYGPKGTGFLYCRRGIKIEPLIFGGSQEKGRRAGTENVSGIIGLAKALELTQINKEKESKRLRELSAYFWDKIQKNIEGVTLNGPKVGAERLPNNLNITFKNIEGEAMLLYLDEYGIMCSTGSACTSESLEPSHVLLAMGIQHEMAHGSLRFTLGHDNSKADIDYIIKYLPAVVRQLREMSPMKH